MAIIPIRTLPDPILRKKAKRIQNIDSSIRRLIGDMWETLSAAGGIGLAAPQIGTSLRLIIVGIPDEEEIVLINPEVVRRRGERLVNEGCLSIPGYVGEIIRSESVTIKGLDPGGKDIRIRADDLLAQALEHEIDHLNGTLYIDRLDSAENLRRIAPAETEL